ncbi:MAG: hypothetical protein EXS18_07505 [Verrucomicrobiae bacterium]|nr:hypothetical protein [Verrucomicrobiae bacterium]
MTTLKKLLLIWAGILVLILVVAQFIITDSKRVHRVLKACESAAREAQPDVLMEQIAGDYQFQGMDWTTLDKLARTIFRKNQFSSMVLYKKTIKIAGDTAEVRFSAAVQPASGSALPVSLSGWRFKMQKRDKQWLITEIEMLTLNGQSTGSLRQMMEQAAAMGGD